MCREPLSAHVSAVLRGREGVRVLERLSEVGKVVPRRNAVARIEQGRRCESPLVRARSSHYSYAKLRQLIGVAATKCEADALGECDRP